MEDLPSRELRNDVSRVLRRVEGGDHLRITVNGRPVAELVPLASRPRSMRWETFIEGIENIRADPGLAPDLAQLLPETTDDVPIP